MLEALEAPLNRARKANARTLPVPIKGWNTRDKLTETRDSAAYAPVLTNWIPTASRLVLRSGYVPHATGLPDADVETLMEYAAATVRRRFAAVGTEIYDVTATGAVGSADVTGLTNAQWQWIMHATTSGQYLVAVNGADGVRTYDGAAWASQSITGVSADDLVAVTAHQARLWFVERGTLKLWYLATYAIAGTATKLDLGALCPHGGELLAVATWTLDGGNGPEDQLVAVTSQGEVVVYAGTDPASATTWTLRGVYKIDRPIGHRCVAKMGADLVILTESGAVQMSQVLAAIDGKDVLSDPIRDDFVAAAVARDAFGWEVALYPRRGWLICNIPTLTAEKYDQFAYNILNGAWFRFSGQPAICWLASGQNLYFGGPGGGVYQADTGAHDNGDAVVGDLQPAWSRYGTSQMKAFRLVRPNFFTDGEPRPLIDMRTDYDDRLPTTIPTLSFSSSGEEWDVAEWDVAEWGGGLAPSAQWITVTGEGIVGAPRIQIGTTTALVAIVSIDVAFEVGGIL